MRNYFKMVRLMFSADKKLLFKSLFIVILFLVLETLMPLYMQWMINQVELNKSIGQFILCAAFFALTYFSLCVLDAVRAETYEHLGKHVLWKTREKIYNVLWHSNYTKVVERNRERFKFVLNTETYLVYAITTVYTVNIMVTLLTLLAFLVIAFVINIGVAIILLIAFVSMLTMSFYSGKRILTNYEKCDNARESDAHINNECVDMVEVTRTNGLMQYYLRKSRNSLESFISTSASSDKIEIFWTGIEQAIHYVIYVFIAGILILSPNYSGGQLVTILFITNYILDQSQSFQKQLQVIIKNIPVFDKVADVADMPIEEGDDVEAISSIVFDSVRLQYADREIFNNLSFEWKRGDKILIEGTNGSGKSSVLKMVVGLVSPASGEIRINNKSISEYNKQHLYKEICYISQEELLLNESVEEYLRVISHTNTTNETIAEWKRRLCLNAEIEQISDSGRNLSGGEKKKILIIKTLLRKDASVVILDEIDSGLDGESKQIMKELEKKLLADEKKIVIKISHIDTDNEGYNKVIQM